MSIFLITGVSSGLGRAIAEAALTEGNTVVGTVRTEEDRVDFDALSPGLSQAVFLDLTDEASIPSLVDGVEREVGAIHVLINNAGYGHQGLIEESTLDEIRRQIEVNLFGSIAMIKAVLPWMRERRAGRIINITSIGGITTFPGFGAYHASKFALEGLSESLGKEVAGLGIHVTAVEPGQFRTEWAGASMTRTARSIADYDAVMNPQIERTLKVNGHQRGDPRKLAAAVLEIIAEENPPAHLLMGSDAMNLAFEKLKALQAEFASWRTLTVSTDFSS